MSSLDEILPRLRSVLEEVHSLAKSTRFSSRSQQHLLAAALLGRILEEVEGIVSTLERRDSACGFIILRSVLEAYIDLLNIVDDPAYADFMHAAFLDQQRQLLEVALEKGSKSPFLARITGSEDATEQLNWVRSKLKELEGRQVKTLSIRKRFKRADQLDYYDGPYASLCWESHNNINVLEARHLRITDGDVEIMAFDPITEEDAQMISDTTAGISANSVAAFKKLVEGEPVMGLDQLTERLKKLRELWHID